jgi:LPXTG-motif cell wall-anchored protein
MRRLVTTLALASGAVLLTAPAVLAEPYYQNCDAARAAGVAPIKVGQPGYRAGLDRDHDGVACEDPASENTPPVQNTPPVPQRGGGVTTTPGGQVSGSTLPNTGTDLPIPALLGVAGALVVGGTALVRAGVAVRRGRHRV